MNGEDISLGECKITYTIQSLAIVEKVFVAATLGHHSSGFWHATLWTRACVRALTWKVIPSAFEKSGKL